MPVLPEVHSMMVPPGFQVAARLRIVNHFDRHTVLDAVARIEGFHFGQNQAWDVGGHLLSFTSGVLPMVSSMFLL
jgi:hypothetical protein